MWLIKEMWFIKDWLRLTKEMGFGRKKLGRRAGIWRKEKWKDEGFSVGEGYGERAA